MKGGQLPTNQLHGVNWGALDIDTSCAPQLMSCNYYANVPAITLVAGACFNYVVSTYL